METFLEERKARSQENLTAFLQTEKELAATYCDIAQSTKSPEHRAQLMGCIQTIVSSLRHFGRRVEDRSIRAGFLKEADRLSRFLEESQSRLLRKSQAIQSEP